MKPTFEKTTLESTITRYRREVLQNSQKNKNIELEIRFQNVDLLNFQAIYEGLLKKFEDDNENNNEKNNEKNNENNNEIHITNMITAMVDDNIKIEGFQKFYRPIYRRDITFKDGIKGKEEYMTKETLLMPFKVQTNKGLTYTISLASETITNKSMSMDEGSIIRIKSRISFPLKIISSEDSSVQLLWRIDLTVVRQVTGNEAKTNLIKIKDQMFKKSTKKTFLKDLDINSTNENFTNQNNNSLVKFRFEVEAEFIPSANDNLRPADVLAVADQILKIANPEYIKESLIQNEIFKLAQYIIKAPGYLMQFQQNSSLKRLLPQVVAITRTDYKNIYPPKNLYITDKADGKRAISIIRDGKAIILTNYLIEGLVLNNDAKYKLDTILDGEYIVNEETQIGTFYAFDAIVINGINISNEGFENRVTYLDDACVLLSDLGIPAESKPFTQILQTSVDELKSLITNVYEKERPYNKDGLIFIEPGKSYVDTKTYKWKSAHDNTIDFLIKRVPTTVLGKHPFIEKKDHKMYFLFVGINNEMFESLALQWCPGYAQIFQKSISGGSNNNGNTQRNYFPIQFSPSDVPLAYIYQHPDNSLFTDIDGKIVEAKCPGNCIAAGGKSQFVDWEIVKIREDRSRDLLTNRYYGNDYYFAELIWANYIDDFPINNLWEGISNDYFMSEKSGIYRAQVGFISFIKTERINTLEHANWVVDIGIGKGQDLGRYLNAGIQNLIAIDQDKSALSELIRRKYSHAKTDKTRIKSKMEKYHKESKKKAMAIYVLVSDINQDPIDELLTKFNNLGMELSDAVVCNLAIHYFMSTTESAHKFVDLVSKIVKVGGHVCITCMFGEAIHALFKKEKISEGEMYQVHETGVLKYSIKRMYSSTKLESVGQKIGIMLPFSMGEYYEEYLVNTKELIEMFKLKGFSCNVHETMNKSLPRFQSRNGSVYSILTEDDKFYLSLYGELVFTKK